VYSAEVLDHFEHPRNPGSLRDANRAVKVENPVCGDVLELSARISGDRIVEIRFKAKGCVPAMACGSAVTELAVGLETKAAAKISREKLIAALGGLPPASGHAAQLAIDALRLLLRYAADANGAAGTDFGAGKRRR
jgi:nitrogen fixation NifU-like protein